MFSCGLLKLLRTWETNTPKSKPLSTSLVSDLSVVLHSSHHQLPQVQCHWQSSHSHSHCRCCHFGSSRKKHTATITVITWIALGQSRSLGRKGDTSNAVLICTYAHESNSISTWPLDLFFGLVFHTEVSLFRGVKENFGTGRKCPYFRTGFMHIPHVTFHCLPCISENWEEAIFILQQLDSSLCSGVHTMHCQTIQWTCL